MSELEAARRLVKSAPELWAACSDPDTLSRHLQAFGEIKITGLEPETTVAWEGESASGTVVLEPSGWGTKVTLTAGVTGELVPGSASVEAAAAPEPELPTVPVTAEPAEPAVPEAVVVEVKPSGGFFSRWRKSPAPEPAAVSQPEPVLAPEPEHARVAAPAAAPVAAPAAEPVAAPVVDALGALEAALDSLGQAHHRPYSRS